MISTTMSVATMDKGLRNLANALIPSGEYLDNGINAVTKVFELLKKRSKYGLDRFYIGGSAGRKTTVMDCDFDCVVFVNDSEPLFEEVLKDFDNILTGAEWPKMGDTTVTRFTIRFTFDGYDIDLVPAPNYANHMAQQPKFPTLAAYQAWKVFQKIAQDPSKSYHFSAGLCESALVFMRPQSSFIHQLVRLCKFWNSSLDINGYISGRSTLIELVAIYAGQKEEKKDDPSLLSGFQTFLTQMVNFRGLKVKFDFDQLSEIRNFTSFHPTSGHFEAPYVIEPANPYNNLAEGVNNSQIEQFIKFAKESLRRLSLCFEASGRLSLDLIFEPQPRVIAYVSERQKEFFKSAKFIVSTQTGSGSNYPTMIIRREDRFKGRDMDEILKKMKYLFGGMIQAFVNSLPVETMDAEQVRVKLHDRITQCVDENVHGRSRQNWAATDRKHEDCDVSFIIPCDSASH